MSEKNRDLRGSNNTNATNAYNNTVATYASAGGGETVKVSADDTTSGFLEQKITSGSARLTLTTNNPAANENLEIDVDPSQIATSTLNNDANFLTETTHDALPSDNPHSVTFTQAVTADAGTDISADEAETLTDGSNADLLHVHTSTAITDFNSAVQAAETITTLSFSSPTLTYTDEDGGVTNLDLSALSGGDTDWLKLDDTDPTSITDDIYTDGNVYFEGKDVGFSADYLLNAMSFGRTVDAHLANETTYGIGAGEGNTQACATLVGYRAGASNTGTDLTAIGDLAGSNNTGNACVFLGPDAGRTNSGNDVFALGSNAAFNNTASACVFIGFESGFSNSGGNCLGVGYRTLRSNANNNNTAVGYSTFSTGSQDNSIGIGGNVGNSGTLNRSLAIGNNAAAGASTNLSFSQVIGQGAGTNTTSSSSFFAGLNTARSGSGNLCIALGQAALENYSADEQIAIGVNAMRNGTARRAIAFGTNSASANGIQNSFIIANNFMPSYTSRANALAAITTGAGGSSGNTYLYYNSTSGAIEAVRL